MALRKKDQSSSGSDETLPPRAETRQCNADDNSEMMGYFKESFVITFFYALVTLGLWFLWGISGVYLGWSSIAILLFLVSAFLYSV